MPSRRPADELSLLDRWVGDLARHFGEAPGEDFQISEPINQPAPGELADGSQEIDGSVLARPDVVVDPRRYRPRRS